MFNKVGQICKPVYMADGSVRLLLELGELTSEEVAELHTLRKAGNITVFLAPEEELTAISVPRET